MAFPGLSCAEEAREARRSRDGGVGKIERRKKSERRRLGLPMPAQSQGRSQACLEGRRKDAGSEAVASCGYLIFEIITDLPLSPFCKLLKIFLKKLKISKNESYSAFETLQLCFKEHFQILPPF